MRRIITGHTAEQGDVFVDDRQIQPLKATLFAGIENYPLWATDVMPPAPNDGAEPTADQFYPGPDGLRFFVFTLSPAGVIEAPDRPTEAEVEEAERTFPGLLAAMTADPDQPGMHATSTIDFGVVLAGEVVLELDGGVERTLNAGDFIVQNGTRHRWHNRGEREVVLAFVLVGTCAAP